MKIHWITGLENIFIALALAEAGDFDTARKVLNEEGSADEVGVIGVSSERLQHDR